MSGAVSTDTRMARPEAIAVAKAFVAEIEPYCDQLVVAGSLRRRLARIGDIEVVCVPKVEVEQVESVGLFGSEYQRRDVDRLDEHMNRLLEAGTVQKRLDANGSPRWGATLKYLTYQGARIDLFTPCAERFGWVLLLRTGPYKFSKQLVVPKVLDNGRRGMTNDRRPGLMPPHIRAKDGWLTYRTSGERIETPTEQSVFELFGLDYLEPWERV